MRKYPLLLAILTGILCLTLRAAPVTNADIEKLLEAGMGDEVILNVIAGGEPHFDTSAEALIDLKKKGASQAVLAAIAKSHGAPAVSTLPAQPDAARLTGRVVDYFGHPIADASVMVEDTTFVTQSQADGRFSLPYVPGTVKVGVKKMGWCAARVELQIATASNYPLKDMQLAPSPNGTGIYYLGRNGLIPLARGSLNVDNQEQRGGSVLNLDRASMINVYSVQAKPTAIEVPPGSRIVLIDNDGAINECFKTVNGGIFYRRAVMGLGVDFRHEYMIVPENDREINPGVWWREFTLEAGEYVLVSSGQMSFKDAISIGIAGARIGEPVYAFRVISGTPEAPETDSIAATSSTGGVEGAASSETPPPAPKRKGPSWQTLLDQPSPSPERPDLQFSTSIISIAYPADYIGEEGTGEYVAHFYPAGPREVTGPSIWVSYQKPSLFALNPSLDKIVKETGDNVTISLDGMRGKQYGPLPTTLAGVEAKTFIEFGTKNGVPRCYGFTLALIKKHIVSVAFGIPANEFQLYFPAYLRMCRSLQIK